MRQNRALVNTESEFMESNQTLEEEALGPSTQGLKHSSP
jgi:hypothetical protein